MANKFDISFEGIRELRQRIKGYNEKLEPDIDAVLEINAQEIARNAKRLAPYRKNPKDGERAGTLRQSITVGKIETRLGYQVGTNVSYAAYMEFGTGNLAAAYVATLPTEFQEMAAQYKAKPRKRLINIPAQPYLYPSYRQQIGLIIKDLNEVLKP